MKNWALLVAGVLGGCAGSADTEATGTYALTVTKSYDGCNVVSNDGDPMPASLAVTQSRATAEGNVSGPMADELLAPLLGSPVLDGSIEGQRISFARLGTETFQSGACSYVVKATVNGEVSGDDITGVVYYQAVTDGSSACSAIAACLSEQRFTGTRTQ